MVVCNIGTNARHVHADGRDGNGSGGARMRTLVVGAGALGGLVAARLRASWAAVCLATRNAESALELKASGLRVSGVGGSVTVDVPDIAAVRDYSGSEFDLIVLATKAHDAMAVAPTVTLLLGPGGTLLPIQSS
jgi:2-dehydropantoate 2-reductase